MMNFRWAWGGFRINTIYKSYIIMINIVNEPNQKSKKVGSPCIGPYTNTTIKCWMYFIFQAWKPHLFLSETPVNEIKLEGFVVIEMTKYSDPSLKK